MKKLLLTFAHIGEAQEFIRQDKFKPLAFDFKGLFQTGNAYLLITGEGLQPANEKISAVCRSFQKQISEVINFGVAGNLTQDLTIGKIYSIRTVYMFTKESVALQFFTSSDPKAILDCVSAANRITNREEANKLSAFGALVDRELWSAAYVCQQFHLPFRAYKLVSDFAGEDAACLDIKNLAQEFSQKLYHFKCRLFA